MTSLHTYARLATALMLGIIILALFYGRYLQVTYYWLLPLIPITGIIVVLGAIVIIWLRLKAIRASSGRLQFLSSFAPLVLMGLGAAILCEFLIDLPIERVHFIKYSLLTLFIFLSHHNRTKVRCALQTLFFGSTVGILDEFSQRYVPNRFFDPRDILLNISAVAITVLIITAANYRGSKPRPTG